MTNVDFGKLKENVDQFMKEKDLTQEELAKAIGMTQPNLNKCLSPSCNKRNFTLAQVCALADYFGTTVDELLGRRSSRKKLAALEIGQFLSTLIASNTVKHFDYDVEETYVFPVTDPAGDWYHDEKVKVKYKAFYFPNYFHVPEYIKDDDDTYDEVRSDIMYGGNDDPSNMAINNFLDRFIGTYEKFDAKDISPEEYRILEDAYYQILKKEHRKNNQLSKSATPIN